MNCETCYECYECRKSAYATAWQRHSFVTRPPCRPASGFLWGGPCGAGKAGYLVQDVPLRLPAASARRRAAPTPRRDPGHVTRRPTEPPPRAAALLPAAGGGPRRP